MSFKSTLKWQGLIILLLAQFGTMADNAGVSVSATSLALALHAQMSQIAVANAMYPLIAGSFMVSIGTLGLFLGWTRTFQIGVALLILAELIAATTHEIAIFNFGARSLAGFGASFLIPSVLGLVSVLYSGRDRVVAFGAIGAVVGIANIIAPMIFGFIIDAFSYRVAFLSLCGFFILLLAASLLLPGEAHKEDLKTYDRGGAVLVSLGLLLFSGGLMQTSSWGLVHPINAPVTLFGISPCLPLMIAGLLVLAGFWRFEVRRSATGQSCLVPVSFFTSPQIRAGVYMCAVMFFVLGAFTILGIPYLQMVAGYSAFETSLVLVFFPVGMVLSSLGTPILFSHLSSQMICRLGMVLSALACLVGAFGITRDGIGLLYFPATFLIGLGTGLIASQASIIVTEAVDQKLASQSGAVQAAARNIGQAIGVALIAWLLMFSLTDDFKSDARLNQNISASVLSDLSEVAAIPLMSNDDFGDAMTRFKIPEDDRSTFLAINRDARYDAAHMSWLVLALLILISIPLLTRSVPKHSLMQDKQTSEGETSAI
ncbi:MFS transporter [Martelella alba]|uniref:MFS transporter n=1 Tax=Martelella alba TaxID=2590451 RepID=A0A506U9E8_9HYPH|nr:MFS transporter [Martelella alba]TPW29711.1 MFS transporter [Martelella alba]